MFKFREVVASMMLVDCESEGSIGDWRYIRSCGKMSGDGMSGDGGGTREG